MEGKHQVSVPCWLVVVLTVIFPQGSGSTISRAMALNMGMLASFDQAKEMLDKRMSPGWTPTLM